jgi:hypothetical protein
MIETIKKITVPALLLLLALSGCQDSGYLKSDIFTADSPLQTQQIRLQESIPADLIYGAVISQDADKAEKLVSSLSHKDLYELVAVIAPTTYSLPDANIFTYDSAGALAEIDTEAIQNLTCCRTIKNLGAVTKDSSWNGALLPMLKKQFPKAKFVLLSVNDKLTQAQESDAATLLKTSLPPYSIVLAQADFETSINQNIRAFRNEFINDTLLTLNDESFDRLPMKTGGNEKPLTILARYLEAKQTEKFIAVDRSGGGLQVAYQKGAPQPKNHIFLVGFGDIMLGRYVRTLMDKNGLDYPFKNLDTGYLNTNDILLGNLEGPVAEKAIRTTKGIAFRFMPDVAPLLKKYGFDVLGLANNHALDMGAAGYDDSLKFLRENGIMPFGDPREINDNSVAKLEVDGQKIAFLGLEEVTYKIDDDKAVRKIKDLTAEGYKVIPFPHWGVEYTHKPNARQTDLAHKFIDAGAIAVIGHHPHVVQMFETYKGRPIFYSLGNAVFDQYWSADTQVGLSIAMIIEDTRTEIFLVPLKIPQSRPEIMNEDDAKKFLEEFAGYGIYADNDKNALLEGRIILTP